LRASQQAVAGDNKLYKIGGVMAVVKKRVQPQTSAGGEPSPASSTSAPVGRYQIPILSMNKFKPSDNFFDYNVMIYGQRKIGKTTLAAQCPDAYFFFFEPNDSYELFKSDIQSWEDFNFLAKQFTETKHQFRTSIIDTGRPCYNMALQYACKKHGFEHPGGQNDRGMAWAKVTQEFELPVRKLMNAKTGFIVICHEAQAEVNTRSGGVFHTISPDLPASAARLFANEIYNIFYYYKDVDGRWLQIEGDEYIQAGHRMKGHFLTPTGERVHRIPMGTDEETGYKNLMLAFDNKQKDPYVKKGGFAPAEGDSEKGKVFKKKAV
jgi:hypothetical protein